MIGNVTAAIGFMKFHIHLCEQTIIGAQMFKFAVAPERNYVRVLAEQEHVRNFVGFARGDGALLEFIRFSVGHQPEINDSACFC